MTTFLAGLIFFLIGYYTGKKVGVALTFMRFEQIIADLQRIENTFTNIREQWNEDQL
jgi:hypothetical protein